MIVNDAISEAFFWFNEPAHKVRNGQLYLTTAPDTDFWQRTHYQFRRDSGHCLLTKVRSDFAMTVRTEFHPRMQYDQCGLILRIDQENWIKTSVEYETQSHARLGSVVTNRGYSDWATIDIDASVRSLWYRIQTRGNDVLIEYSDDGVHWKQLRITHLLQPFDTIDAGIYACSPMQSSFVAIFDHFTLAESQW